MSHYIAERAGAHFTAKEFRTWNVTVLMALLLAGAGTVESAIHRKRVINTSVRGVAAQLGDTTTVARASYIDPRLISQFEADGVLATIPPLPVPSKAEAAVAALLAG